MKGHGLAAAPPRRASGRMVLICGLLGIVLGMATLAVRYLGDFDLPWHLAVGRVVAATRSLPRTDDLAFTHRPVQHVEVLSDLFLYGVIKIAGPLGLQIVGALCAAAVAVLLFLTARPAGPVALLIVAFAMATMGTWLIVRPATFSFVFIALELWMLERHRRRLSDAKLSRRGTTRRPARLWALIPLHAAWANVHGFVVIGLGLLGMYTAYRILAHFARGRAQCLLPAADGRDAGTTAVVFLGSIVATCVNMAGPRLFLGPLRASNDFGYVTEWATTRASFLLEHEPLAAIAIPLVLGALLFGRDVGSGRKMPTLFDLGLLGAALVLGHSAVRLVPVAVLLVTPWLARRVGGFVPATRVTELACAVSTLLVAPYLALRGSDDFGVGFHPRHFPIGAVAYVEQAQPVGRMWNFFPYGGYLTWRLYPRYRVFIDGRSGWVHDPALFARGIESERSLPVFYALAAELGMEFAVCNARESEAASSALAAAEDWGMVYWDDLSAVYVRTGGPNDRLAASGYRLLRHRTSFDEILQLAISPGSRGAALAHDGALAAAQDPTSPRAAFLGACGALATRQSVAFAMALDRLASLAPGHPALAALRSAGLVLGPSALPGTSR